MVAFLLVALCCCGNAYGAHITYRDFGYDARPNFQNGDAGIYIPLYPGVRHLSGRLLFDANESRERPYVTVNARRIPLRRSKDGRAYLFAAQFSRGTGGASIAAGFASPRCGRVGPNLSTVGSYIEIRAPRPRSANDFFDTYGGRIHFVLPRVLDDGQRSAILASAYFLHQRNRWRRWDIDAGYRPRRDALNIFVGKFRRAISLRRGRLYVTAAGLLNLDRRASDLFSASAVLGDGIRPPANSFADLGIATQTYKHGPLQVPFQLAQLGGVPKDLIVHLRLHHAALAPPFRRVDVLLNGALVNTFALSAGAADQTLDVPLPPERLGGSNALAVTFPDTTACTASARLALLNSSSFSWRWSTQWAASVADFAATANGTLSVLLDSDKHLPAAVALLDKIGELNTSIARVNVLRADAPLPTSGYAIVIARGSTRGGESVLGRIAASDGSGFAYARVLPGPVPQLAIDYNGDDRALNGFARASSAAFAQDDGEYLVVSPDGLAYLGPTVPASKRQFHDDLRQSMPKVAAYFTVALATGIVLLTMRRYAA